MELEITNCTLSSENFFTKINNSLLFETSNRTKDLLVPYYQRLETYIVPFVFSLILFVGVLGNGTLVYIFLRHTNMRSVPNTYIFSLALGDLLVIITSVPFTSTIYTVESWPFGTVICKLSEYFKDVSIGVSVFTLTALSAERYSVIVNPISRYVGGSVFSTKPLTLIIASAIWIASIVFALPSAIFSNVQKIVLDETNTTMICVCSPFPVTYGKIYIKVITVIKFLVYYAVPLIVIACFYILMAHHLEKSTINIQGELQNISLQIRGRKKVAKMVLSFVIIFIICFLPYHVFMLWFHLYPNTESFYDEYWHAFRIIGFCLSFINSCINPVALYLVSNTFRKYFNRYIFCCFNHTHGKFRSGRRWCSSMPETLTHTMVHLNTIRQNNIQMENMKNSSFTTTNVTIFI